MNNYYYSAKDCANTKQQDAKIPEIFCEFRHEEFLDQEEIRRDKETMV